MSCFPIRASLIFMMSVLLFSNARAEELPALPEKLVKFFEKIEAKKGDLQGGAIAVLYKGQVVYTTTFGHRKGQTGEITSKTLFPLASVSKSVSAMAIALQVEAGAIGFDDKVKLPWLINPVSLRHVLSHTTGYAFTGNSQIEHGLSRPKLLDKLKTQKPKCKPGACYFYSNTVYGMAEEILNTRQLSLEKAVANLRRVLNTDGIQLLPVNPTSDVAFPHNEEKTDDGWVLKQLSLPPYYPKAAPAAAGVCASLDGMISFFRLSFGYRPDLISQTTLDRMQKPIIANRDIDKWNLPGVGDMKKIGSFYGMGWRILKKKQHPGKEIIFHSGYLSGISTFIGFIPSEEIGIIMLVNQGSRHVLGSGLQFWDQLFD
jgi:beta-lactamase class C